MPSTSRAVAGLSAVVATVLMTGCMHSPGSGNVIARASFVNAQNQDSGSASITDDGGKISLNIDARGVPAGLHGIHIHQVGRCDASGFESAGPHWNPTSRKHGLSNNAGPHAGDIPNVEANSTGTVSTVVSLNMADDIRTMLDADGAALIIHATADDNVTDPSGNSGGRILCGVIKAAS